MYTNRTENVAALAAVACSVALRVFFCFHIDLMPEEAYYWNYSQHLDIGYLDHPPLVAWLIKLGCLIFGNTETGVRVPALACGAIATFFLHRLTRNVFGHRSALAAVVLAQVLPFFFLSAFLMTPDAPLTAAWAASLYFLERALIGNRSSAWFMAGVCLGFGLLAKYTMGLLGLACVLFMLSDPASRRWFRCWQPYAAVALSFVVFAPVLVWNFEHDWASFVFQTSRRLAEHPQFALQKLVGSALILLTPTGCVAVAIALARRLDRPPGWRFLQMATLVPLSVFAVFSLRHEVKLDWMGAPWTAAVPVLAFGVAEARGRASAVSPRWLRVAWPPTLAAFLLCYAAGFTHLAFGLPGIGYSAHTELSPIGWRTLAEEVDRIAESVKVDNGGRVLIVGMDRYQIASELAFYSRGQVAGVEGITSQHLFGGLGLMYERWCPSALQTGRTLLLVTFDANDLTDRLLSPQADRLEPMHSEILMRNGRIIRPFYWRVLQGYRAPAVAGDPPISGTSSVHTRNMSREFEPNVVLIATSPASRPRAINIRPIRR